MLGPLIAALSYHQFFEGFALGGLHHTAEFRTPSTVMMACFFAITAPAGIGVGLAISSSYNAYSPGALITEGVLDCMWAGMLGVHGSGGLDSCLFPKQEDELQVVSYVILFLGAGLMSLLAMWD